jgi:predicted methyltransferase
MLEGGPAAGKLAAVFGEEEGFAGFALDDAEFPAWRNGVVAVDPVVLVLASLFPFCFQLGHHFVYVLLGKKEKTMKALLDLFWNSGSANLEIFF